MLTMQSTKRQLAHFQQSASFLVPVLCVDDLVGKHSCVGSLTKCMKLVVLH